MAKHFNRGNVWGRVMTATAEKKNRYIQLKIDCSSEKYGKVHTYGRIWGKERFKAIQDFLKKDKNALIRFTGFFQQYEKDGQHFSNYTFYEWTPAGASPDQGHTSAGGMSPQTVCRAAFILVGNLRSEDIVDGETRLTLDLLREGIEDARPIEESFELWTLSEDLLEGILEGDTIEVKGMIRPKQAEDEYGASGGKIRPYIMAVAKRGDKNE